MTVTVIVVSITYLVLTLPGTIYYIRSYITLPWTTGYERATAIFTAYLMDTLSQTNKAINFYLYCLTGRKFREEFIKVMCCGRKRGQRGAHQ